MGNFLRNKKGEVGLGTVGNILIGFLILGVIALAMYISLSTLKTSDIIGNETKIMSFNNEQITLNSTPQTPTSAQQAGATLTEVLVTNATSGVTVLASNYTLTGASFVNTTGAVYNTKTVNISANVTYTIRKAEQNDLIVVSENISDATTSFFTNSKTITTISFVILLLSLLGLIILVIKRFGGGDSFKDRSLGGSGGSGGGSGGIGSLFSNKRTGGMGDSGTSF